MNLRCFNDTALKTHVFFDNSLDKDGFSSSTKCKASELQQLSDHIEKIEQSLAGTDDCVLDIYSLEETHGNRMDVLEEELASVKACLIALRKEFDAHKNVRCPMSEEIKNHFKKMIERDEQPSEMDSPPAYNLRSHVIDIE